MLLWQNLNEGQQLLASMQNNFPKVINRATSEKQNELCEYMTTPRNSWDQLNMDLKSIAAQLKSGVLSWAKYNDSRNKLEK